MSKHDNVDVFRRLIDEGFNKGNFDALDELFHPDCQEHQYQLPPTLDGLKQSIASLRSSFPDLRVTIDDVIADDDKVWVRSTARGTHRGDFMGIPPSGVAITIDVIDICRFSDDGKIIEHWGVPDRFAQLSQLGLIPQRPTSQDSGA